ncbi:MAG: PD-(D/E)XK nuclease family protein, partial [Armatimonadia bacterium]
MANPEHLSYSAISSYLLCGESWRRRYVLNEKAPTSDALVLGSAFHGAVEAYMRGADDLQMAYERAWSQELEGEQEITWEDGAPGPTHDAGLRMVMAKPVRMLLDEVRANFDPEHGQIERRVELHVPGVPVPIVGYIDIITKDGVPGDF